MATKTKPKTIAQWMDENSLTLDDLAQAADYSHGAAANWRQGINYPEPRAVKAIARVGKRRGWTEFPPKVAA